MGWTRPKDTRRGVGGGMNFRRSHERSKRGGGDKSGERLSWGARKKVKRVEDKKKNLSS